MSFSWSTSSIPSLTGMKPAATTNSFADALKRLAEHVEEKNKNIDTTSNGTASVLVQSSADFSNRMNPSYVNSSIPSEQALRLYTQFIQETERREDIRRSYLRAFNGPDGSNMNSPPLNRRLDAIDPFRFLTPHLSNPVHPSAYLQSLSPQNRLPFSSLFFPNVKPIDPAMTTRTCSSKNDEKKTEPSSKPKSKLFRPYDLDSPNSTSHQSPSSPPGTKKSNSSPSIFPSTSPTFLETSSSSGKEKQLFNSLGLVQQSTDLSSEPSPVVSINEDSISIDTMTAASDESNSEIDPKESSAASIKFKRKSISPAKNSSHRKQSKIDIQQNIVP